jgi:hypothetical protein
VIENHQAGDKEIKQFLLVAGDRSIFKKAPPYLRQWVVAEIGQHHGSSGIVRTYGRNSRTSIKWLPKLPWSII